MALNGVKKSPKKQAKSFVNKKTSNSTAKKIPTVQTVKIDCFQKNKLQTYASLSTEKSVKPTMSI